ncbi:aminotransferase [Pholiota molesta]|nr:aminotransferase [Pholiota molesta]
MFRARLTTVSRLNRVYSSSLRYKNYAKLNTDQSVRRLSTNSNPPEDLHEFGVKHVTKGLGRITEGIMVKGEVHTKLLDFTCGIGVTNLGHAHPVVSKAAADQCMQLVHSQCSIALHEPYLRLIERLLPVMPDPSLDSFFFWNSGSEANVDNRQNIICMQEQDYLFRRYSPLMVNIPLFSHLFSDIIVQPGVFSIPYPYWHQSNMPLGTSASVLSANSLYQLELLLSQQTAPADTAAIIIEPVLGEGGYVPAPPEFLQGLRKICDKHGILLIVDEVQSGFGRAGNWFAISESGVRPDILVMAKGLGNGFPISGVPGSMGGTYAGNAVACAAAVAVNKVMVESNIFENVQARSNELFSALNALKYDPSINPHILDIRGRGLMVGVEFASPKTSEYHFSSHSAASLPPSSPHQSGLNHPENMASRVARKCIEKGMLILTTSVYEVIRFIPPLNVTQEDMKKGCAIFAESVREVVKEG